MFDKADFSTLRHTQPQWVIDQLIEQTARQGSRIRELLKEVADLKVDVLHSEEIRLEQKEEIDRLTSLGQPEDYERHRVTGEFDGQLPF